MIGHGATGMLGEGWFAPRLPGQGRTGVSRADNEEQMVFMLT